MTVACAKTLAPGLRYFADIALNLLKQDTTAQLGIKNKRWQTAWDENYLLTLLSQ